VSTTRPPSFDERYAAPVEASRRGAHRARPNPLASALPVLAGMAVVVLVIVGAFALLSDRGTSSGPSSVAAAPTTTPSPAASASATPSATASVVETPQPSVTEPAGEVDKSAELVVLNSTGVSGLARKVGNDLTEKGWTVGESGNASTRLSKTRIYYAENEQAATAEAIAAALGFGETKKSAARAEKGITVVLGRDAS
jgi:hypothetical protein